MLVLFRLQPLSFLHDLGILLAEWSNGIWCGYTRVLVLFNLRWIKLILPLHEVR